MLRQQPYSTTQMIGSHETVALERYLQKETWLVRAAKTKKLGSEHDFVWVLHRSGEAAFLNRDLTPISQSSLRV